MAIQNDEQARQAINAGVGRDNNLHQILTYLVNRQNDLVDDVANFSSYAPFIGLGVLHDDDAIPAGDGMIPDSEFFSGEGISGADVGASTSNFRGFLLEAGTYIVWVTWGGATSADVMVRYNTAAPDADADLDSDGTLVYEHDTGFSGNSIHVPVTLTADNYIWAMNDDPSNQVGDYMTMMVMRVA